MRKFIALSLFFSILLLSGNLYAKKKGAELIAVKQNSLLLLERKSGADVTVDIGDVRVVKIVRKWKAEKGFLYGSIVGGVGVAGLDALVAATIEEDVRWGNLVLFSIGVVFAVGMSDPPGHFVLFCKLQKGGP